MRALKNIIFLPLAFILYAKKRMKQAKIIRDLITSAQKSKFGLWKLNFVLGFGVPFNKRHNFVVKEIGNDYVTTFAPYKRKNFNHLKGLHACGIATISEFCTGILLMKMLDPSLYRIIMSEMRMEYHYQAKMAVVATATMSDEELQKEIIEPLKDGKPIIRTMIAKVHDVAGNHIATAHITWQLKAWQSVKTKV